MKKLVETGLDPWAVVANSGFLNYLKGPSEKFHCICLLELLNEEGKWTLYCLKGAFPPPSPVVLEDAWINVNSRPCVLSCFCFLPVYNLHSLMP